MQKNLVVVSRGFGTEKVFSDLFDSSKKIRVQHTPYYLEENDVLVFEGGTDISPKLYGEKPNSYTSYPDVPRDIFESNLFRQAKDLGVPIIGICRGAQLVCALSGGKLIQHVDNHDIDHMVNDHKGRSYMVTSSHHQMMLPKGTKHKILASCKRATVYIGEYNKSLDVEEDPEVVWFEDTKSLAIQGHPEWMKPDSAGVSIIREYVKEFILGE